MHLSAAERVGLFVLLALFVALGIGFGVARKPLPRFAFLQLGVGLSVAGTLGLLGVGFFSLPVFLVSAGIARLTRNSLAARRERAREAERSKWARRRETRERGRETTEDRARPDLPGS